METLWKLACIGPHWQRSTRRFPPALASVEGGRSSSARTGRGFRRLLRVTEREAGKEQRRLYQQRCVNRPDPAMQAVRDRVAQVETQGIG